MQEGFVSALFGGAVSLLSPLSVPEALPEFGTIVEGL